MKTAHTWRGTEDIPHLWLSDLICGCLIRKNKRLRLSHVTLSHGHPFWAVEAALSDDGCHSRPVIKALHFRTLMALPACLPIKGQV